MTPHLSPLSHHKASPKDLAQSFKALIYELFSLEVAQADAQALHALEQSYGEFDFGGAIVCFASAASSETLSSSSLGHTNLAFSLICSKPSATLSKSLYAKATQAINRAIPSYNIIFFLNPQEDLLTISFATRREHKRAADQDVLERVIIIKDLSLLSPSKGHLRNLDSIAKASKHKKQMPTPIDQLYQESIKALSIESLNEKFYQEVVGIFIALIDSIQLPTPSLRASEATEAIHPTPSLRGEAEAIHKSKADSSDEAMDCHADKSARNDKKKADSSNEADSKKTAQNLSEQAKDSRICDEKSGLCEHSQGRALGVRNRRECEAIADLSRKAESTSQASQDNTKREFSLRLLSRLLFCKFLEKKGIIDTAIFSTTLSGNYYHEVLEPLFFSTLNTPKNARDYALLDPHIAALLEQIPYLNGGLFAPQASDFYSPSRPTAYHTTLKVPNTPLAELFTLLESYHFSIDESTPDAQEVGLNPELLGMVFESLLSELFTDNRKDSTSSLRKSTGSYYTPREIVQYMCRTSLYQYLLSKMDSAFGLESRISSPRLCDSHSRLISARGSKSHDSSSKILESTSSDKTAAQKSCREQTALSPSLRALREQSVAIHKSKVDSSVDCHADKSARNDSKNAANKKADSRNEAQNLNDSQAEGFADDFVGCQGVGEGIYLSGNEQAHAADSRKSAAKPTPETLHALIFHQDPSHLPPTTHAQILAALSTLKVLDPACGSGAFPIGLMQEILDLQDLLGDTRSPYTRKLEILQSNIYGIDIQPMATEISRLRCFLSLIVDESPHSIAPLPNLEFKFLSANSLLPLPKDSILEYDGYQADKQKLESIRQANFTADLKSREKLKQDYLKTAAHIARNLILHDQGESPLTLWNPYDPHSVAGFFDSEYMFGLQGFDIVIGNPPYISAPNQMKDKFLAQQRETLKNISYYKTLHKKWDLYIPFIERGLKILNFNGMCSMIIPYPYTNQPYAQKSRENVFKDFSLVEIADLHESKVFNAEVLNCIVFIQNNNANNEIFISKLHHHTIERIYKKNRNIFIQDEKSFIWNLTGEREIDKYQKLNTLGDFCYISVGMGLHSSESNKNYKFTKKDLISRTMDKIHNRAYIEGKDIEKYQIVNVKYLEYNTERCPSQCREPRFPELFEAEKLVINKIGYLKSVIDTNKTICDQTIRVCVLWHNLKNINNKSIISSIKKFSNFERNDLENLSQQVNLLYLLGILNSKYIALLLDEIRGVGNIDLNPEYLRKIPIPKITESNKPLANEIIQCVEQILSLRGEAEAIQPQSSLRADEIGAAIHKQKELESKIDSLVYKLYDLSETEIHTIDSKT